MAKKRQKKEKERKELKVKLSLFYRQHDLLSRKSNGIYTTATVTLSDFNKDTKSLHKYQVYFCRFIQPWWECKMV